MTAVQRVFLLTFFPTLLFAQFIPDPTNAQFVLATPSWIVWTTQKRLADMPKVDDGSFRIEVVIQSEPGQPAWKVYEHISGMVNMFSPVWVWKDGSVIAWGGWFSMAKKNVLYEPENLDSITGSSEMPVLRSVGENGVIVMAPTEEVTMTSNHRLYFVPWTWDKRVVDYRRQKQMTDDEGIGYWSGSVLYADGKFLTSRSGKLFCYSAKDSRLDTLRMNSIDKASSPIAFDGKSALVASDTQCIYIDLQSKIEQKIYLPPEWQWVGLKGSEGFGIRTENDGTSSTYKLIRRELLTGVEKILGQYSEDNNDYHAPIAFIQGNTLWFWANKQWLKFKQ